MKRIIITSEVDKNYFIINNGAFSLAYLCNLLIDINEELANQLYKLTTTKELQNKQIFVPKNSDLGIMLEKLIEDNKLIDMSEIIEPRHLTNALISQILTSSNEEIEIITNMIKDNTIGAIVELATIYPKETLKNINRIARLTYFINSEKKGKYLKEISLTGYELQGVTYQNGIWYNIDIYKKNTTELDSSKKKVLEK